MPEARDKYQVSNTEPARPLVVSDGGDADCGDARLIAHGRKSYPARVGDLSCRYVR